MLINKKNKMKCTACGACLNICGKNAITFESDSYGFLYPSVDYKKCVNCCACEDVCPIEKSDKKKGKAYFSICGSMQRSRDLDEFVIRGDILLLG